MRGGRPPPRWGTGKSGWQLRAPPALPTPPAPPACETQPGARGRDRDDSLLTLLEVYCRRHPTPAAAATGAGSGGGGGDDGAGVRDRYAAARGTNRATARPRELSNSPRHLLRLAARNRPDTSRLASGAGHCAGRCHGRNGAPAGALHAVSIEHEQSKMADDARCYRPARAKEEHQPPRRSHGAHPARRALSLSLASPVARACAIVSRPPCSLLAFPRRSQSTRNARRDRSPLVAGGGARQAWARWALAWRAEAAELVGSLARARPGHSPRPGPRRVIAASRARTRRA